MENQSYRREQGTVRPHSPSKGTQQVLYVKVLMLSPYLKPVHIESKPPGIVYVLYILSG